MIAALYSCDVSAFVGACAVLIVFGIWRSRR